MTLLRRLTGVLTRVSLERPPQSSVLQFSGTTSALQSLGSQINLICMPSVGERVLLRVLLRSISRGRFSRWGYYKTFAEKAGARLILVWNDTNSEAYQLQHYIDTPVWCLQNGVRHDVAPAQSVGFLTNLSKLALSKKPKATKYFTFGESSAELLSRYVDAEYIQSGSFRLNRYLSQRTSRGHSRNTSHQRIGLIVSFPNGSDIPGGSVWNNQSTFVKVNEQNVTYHDYFSVDALVARSLSNVAIRRAMHFSIIGKRSINDSVERDYFSQAQGCHGVDVIAHEKGSGYEVADTYDYLFTVDSTLGYEMLAAGKKVGFVSNRFLTMGIETSDMTFGYPLALSKDGACWTSATDQEQIELFAEKFLDLPENVWSSIHQELTPRLMVTDPGNRTFHDLLSAELGLQ